jgi:hypothetical protein
MSEHLDQSSYRLEWIACKNLSVVWIQAQRPYKESRAREIADNFDPDLFDPLKVTKPNGVGIYHVCDGQTRKGAVEMMYGPEECVPCLVAPEGDPVRAAEIFLKTNTGRRPPTIIDNFKVSVTAQRPVECGIDRIVRHHHYRVESSNAQDAISAVGALRFVYTVCGPQMLDHTLRTIHDVWDSDHNAVVAPLLRGFGVFLNEFHTHIKYPRFVETTKKKYSPGSLLRDAKAARELHGGGVTDIIVQLLTTNYNRNLRDGHPLKRKESKAP